MDAAVDGRAVVLAGDGLVARLPGVLCVARCPEPEPLARLLTHCRAAAGPDPGRALARRLAGWLAGPDAPPDALVFGTVSTAGDAVAVFLSGAVDARVGDVALSGADSAAWTDRLVPPGPVRLALDGAGPAPAAHAVLLDLRAGVVPGGGVEVGAAAAVSGDPADAGAPVRSWPVDAGPRTINAQPTLIGMEVPEAGTDPAVRRAAVRPAGPTAPADAPTAPPGAVDAPDRAAARSAGAAPGLPGPPVPPSPATAPAPGPAASPVPAAVALGKGPGAPRARTRPRRTEAILGVAPEEPPRPPLEAGEPAGTGTRSLSGGPATAELSGPKPGEARGHLCSRGHLNDPRSHFCVLCGIRMNERTGVLVIGSRPPLGLLVFDDGATYTVDAEYLVGRMPESDDRVRTGGLRSIVVEDRSGAVSRVHAEVRVDNWDVVLVDSGSRNGTFVASPGDPAWTPVPPGRSRRLEPGMRVRLGGRTFVFESPSGVR